MYVSFVQQTEISKRLSALINQLVPFLSQEHRQQVLTAVERAKQITMAELNAVIEVSFEFTSTKIIAKTSQCIFNCLPACMVCTLFSFFVL
jgi:hypothetical protein